MKSQLAFFLFVLASTALFSQEANQLPFHGFRGNTLKVFDANGQSFSNKDATSGELNGSPVILVHPGNSYFVINSAKSHSAALFDEQGTQLQLVELQTGENHLHLADLPAGNYYLRDKGQKKLISMLIHTK